VLHVAIETPPRGLRMSGLRFVFGSGPGALEFQSPRRVLRAERADQRSSVLNAAEEHLSEGGWLAAYVRYDGTAVAGIFDEPRRFALHANGGVRHSALLPLVSQDGYARSIASLQSSIRDGDVYQVNYTIPLALESEADTLSLFAHYAQATNAAYQAYVEDGDRALLSWSPELFLRFADGRIATKPMKGTAALHRIEELGSP
jgi:anthranilate/para-aminobenzoate synthase component I